MAEAAVVKASHALLTKRGAWWVKTHGAGMGRNGVPDDLAIYKGRPILIEYKHPRGGRVAPLQEWEMSRARRAGAITIVARHVDDVRAVLDDIDAGAHKTPKDAAPEAAGNRLRAVLDAPNLHVLPGGEQ